MIACVKVKKARLNILHVDSFLTLLTKQETAQLQGFMIYLFIFLILRGENRVTKKNVYIKVLRWDLSCRCMIMWFGNHPLMLPLRQVGIIWIRECSNSALSPGRWLRGSSSIQQGNQKPLCHCLFIRLSVNALTYFWHCARLNVFTVYTMRLYLKNVRIYCFSLFLYHHKLNIFEFCHIISGSGNFFWYFAFNIICYENGYYLFYVL